MTDSDWRSCTNPQEMLEFIRGMASERQLRLFGCACVRRGWRYIKNHRSREAVEVVEGYADSQVALQEVEQAREQAWDVIGELDRASDQAEGTPDGAAQAESAAGAVANLTGHHSDGDRCPYFTRVTSAAYSMTLLAGYTAVAAGQPAHAPAAEEGERLAQADLVRDIFGNPFLARAAIAPTWLTWNNGLVKRLAEAIYEERGLPGGTLDNERLLVLADALEEAGCDSEEMLAHLRERGAVHVRGCWCLDLVLGKA